jgi:hypothetical protein
MLCYQIVARIAWEFTSITPRPHRFILVYFRTGRGAALDRQPAEERQYRRGAHRHRGGTVTGYGAAGQIVGRVELGNSTP